MKGSSGLRQGIRKMLKKGLREKFKPETFMQEFKPGDKVVIRINPSSRNSMVHSRFNGKMGIVTGKRGSAFIVSTRLGNKKKELQASPEHLRKA